MQIFAPHIDALHHAIRSSSPMLVLPPAHPEYIRGLLMAWSKKHTTPAEIKLIEPGVGRSHLTPGDASLPGGKLDKFRRADATTDLLIEQIEAAIHRTDPKSAPLQLIWLTALTELLTEPATKSHLAALCRRITAHKLPIRLILDTPTTALDAILEPWFREVELSAPHGEDHANFIKDRFLKDRIVKTTPDQDELTKSIIQSLRGLEADAINLVIDAAFADYSPTKENSDTALIQRINKERERHLDRASGLKVINKPFKDGDLQGMNRFQRYLEYVRVLFEEPQTDASRHFQPRGVLLVGLPGCGKSLAARMTAHKLNVPLLQLDVGAMMGKHLGDSEANLSRVLDAAQAAAPCVLWIDEIEKALGGLGNSSEGGGTGSRMLGKLLSWMQDHDSQVYLFATANKVDILPPELLRRGRFDELWQVKLPTPEERRAILIQKLRELPPDSHGNKILDATLSAIVDGTTDPTEFQNFWQDKTHDYTGADLTSVVFEARLYSVVHQEKISIQSLIQIIDSGFEPMSVQFKDDIEKLTESLDRHGFRDVTEPNPDRLPQPVHPDRLKHKEPLPDQIREFWDLKHPVLLVFKDSDPSLFTLVHLSFNHNSSVHNALVLDRIENDFNNLEGFLNPIDFKEILTREKIPYQKLHAERKGATIILKPINIPKKFSTDLKLTVNQHNELTLNDQNNTYTFKKVITPDSLTLNHNIIKTSLKNLQATLTGTQALRYNAYIKQSYQTSSPQVSFDKINAIYELSHKKHFHEELDFRKNLATIKNQLRELISIEQDTKLQKDNSINQEDIKTLINQDLIALENIMTKREHTLYERNISRALHAPTLQEAYSSLKDILDQNPSQNTKSSLRKILSKIEEYI